MKEMIKYGTTLAIICLAAAGRWAWVKAVTHPRSGEALTWDAPPPAEAGGGALQS